MDIQTVVVGSLEENCYILTHNGEAAVIDPGAQADVIIKKIEESKAKIKMILLTHGHFDHIGGVSPLARYSGAPVYIHTQDADMLRDNSKNLSFMTMEKVEAYSGEIPLLGGEVLTLGGEEIKVHHTPGHSRGCVCYECGDNLFGGDLLFKGSIGKFDRTELRTHMNSLKYVMDSFDDCVKVYPGHGEITTIGEERISNPYILHHIRTDN